MLRWIHFFLWCSSLLIAGAAWAQGPCDPTLTPELDPATQYRERENDRRCEGFYSSEASHSGGLDLVGLLQRPLRYRAGEEVLHIESPLRERRILVRGQGIPVKLYYRLDAVLQPGQGLRWPISLLLEQGIRPEQVGLYGRLAERHAWFVPLDIRGKQAPAEQPRLLLRAAVEIAEVYWRYAEAAGGPCGAMTDWHKLDAPRGFAGGEAIPINLPRGRPRQLCVEVAARASKSGDWLKRLVRIQR